MTPADGDSRAAGRRMAWRTFEAASLPDDPWALTAQECTAFCRTATRTARRAEWVRGRVALHRTFDCLAPAGASGISFVSAPDGAPVVVDASGWWASLSHEGDHVAAVVADFPVGIDLCVRRAADKAAAVLSRLRHVSLPSHHEPSPASWWAALEAAIKLRRSSITTLLFTPVALDEGPAGRIQILGLGGPITVSTIQTPDYALALALDSSQEEPACSC